MPRVSTKSFSYPQEAFENFRDAFVTREPTTYGDTAFVEQLRDLLREFPDRWTDADIVTMLREMHPGAEAVQLQSLLNKAKQLDPHGPTTRRPSYPSGGRAKSKPDIPTIKSDSVGKAPADKPKDGNDRAEGSDRARRESDGRTGSEMLPKTDGRESDDADPQDNADRQDGAQSLIDNQLRQPPMHQGIEN